MASIKKDSNAIQVAEVSTESTTFVLLGTTPLIMNRMTAKVKQELLFPSLKLKKEERSNRLKHDPIAEFRDSAGRDRNPDGPTEIVMPSTAFKGALASAALDAAGASKAAMGRLTFVEGENIGIYGVPKVFMQAVRSSGMNAAPDIRTRAILPRWCAVVTYTYACPMIKQNTLINLLKMAGLTIGVGDFRPQKGQGTFGQFELASLDDPRVIEIMSLQGREAQLEAFDNPLPYDPDTAELLSWFSEAVADRGLKAAA